MFTLYLNQCNIVSIKVNITKNYHIKFGIIVKWTFILMSDIIVVMAVVVQENICLRFILCFNNDGIPVEYLVLSGMKAALVQCNS